MLLSIIIPTYNATATIKRCLDSIYSQDLDANEFEVICVDDCSTDMASVNVIEDYCYDSVHPNNLLLIRHETNKRQGGARNTGVKKARGEWILFIDADDFFLPESIIKVLNIVQDNPNLDLVMFTYCDGTGSEILREGLYSDLSQEVMTGTDFIQKQPVPWVPWCYLYKKSCIVQNDIWFVEEVRFEDADFVLRYTAKAKLAQFVPIKCIYHVTHKGGTSQFGNDKQRIKENLMLGCRTGENALKEMEINPDAGRAMMGHAIFMRKAALISYIWRLSFHNMLKLLHECRYTFKTGNWLVDFTNRHQTLTAICLTIMKPLFYLAIGIKTISKLINSRKHDTEKNH